MIRWVLLRDPLGQFELRALLCTDPMKDPLCVIGWFVQRWAVEVTFREVRDHLGFESQRQWTDKAIAHTTPVCSVCSPWSRCSPASLRRAHPARSGPAARYYKQQSTF